MEESGKASHAERLQAIHAEARSLVEHLQALTSAEPAERLPWLLDLIVQVQDLITFCAADADSSAVRKKTPAPTKRELQEFGRLLRDRRNGAGFSRLQLARRAKLSDATVKFLETARHPPSRATLIRLIGVDELKLTWKDAPGSPPPPAIEPPPVLRERPQSASALNCLLTPTFDPVRRIAELGHFLNGAGGHLEQSCAYLDHHSAAAYLALCQQSAGLAGLRASIPLSEAARHIVAATGPVALQAIALGSGEAQLEVRLVQHLLEQGRLPRIELCLLDISQPLLACGHKHAAESFTAAPQVSLWSMQCDMHELPLYSRLLGSAGTAPLDHEPRFLQHTLPSCARGDLLLLDLQLARAAAPDPEKIKKRDPQWAAGVSQAEAAWLGGLLWRHGKDVLQVDFHWDLDTHLPLPGSYALGAVARVLGQSGAQRQFSMFRYRRYAPDAVAACLRGLGWDELASWPFGGASQPSSLRLFRKSTESLAHG